MPRKCVRPGSRSASECADRTAIEIATEEVFGNCPKYIQARPPEDDGAQTPGAVSRWGTTLDTGTTLQLTGRARILWEIADRAGWPGAERAVEVEVDEVVEIAGQGPLGWRFVEYSPFNPR